MNRWYRWYSLSFFDWTCIISYLKGEKVTKGKGDYHMLNRKDTIIRLIVGSIKKG